MSRKQASSSRTVDVTAEDLAQGIPGSPTRSAAALAASRAFGQAVEVLDHEVYACQPAKERCLGLLDGPSQAAILAGETLRSPRPYRYTIQLIVT